MKIDNLIFKILFLTLCSIQIVSTQSSWGNLRSIFIHNYQGPAMEPFISRDGKWVFFNSQNTGNDTTLYYAKFINSTYISNQGKMTGAANGPIPHLDAVPSMDDQNNFYWISTRDYPENYDNVLTGVFDNGNIETASHVQGDIYIKEPVWIVMDQEINIDGSILFYVNALFENPPGPNPIFANISLAKRNEDGTFTKHPNAEMIMEKVNAIFGPQFIKYGPSSFGKDSLELFFSSYIPHSNKTSALFYATRKNVDAPFGYPVEIVLPEGQFIEPEAPCISADGKLLMFNRMDCDGKYGCNQINLYSLDRLD